MSAQDSMDPDITPEQREWVLRMNGDTERRRRENDYAPRPGIPEKMDSMAPGVRVVREATSTPIPFPRRPEGEAAEND